MDVMAKGTLWMSRQNRLTNQGKWVDVKANSLSIKGNVVLGCQGKTDFLTRERGLWMSGQKELCGCKGMRNFVDVKAKGLCGCQGQTDFLTRARGLWISGQKDFEDVKAKQTF